MKDIDANAAPEGKLAVALLPAMPDVSRTLTRQQVKRYAFPRKGLSDFVNDWRSDNVKRAAFKRGMKDAIRARRAGEFFGLAHVEGSLFMRVIRLDGRVDDLGLAGLNIVTTTGVTFIADAFRGSVEPEIMKYHGIGTGATAEVIGNTALGTEATTQYNPDNTRATGSLAGSANVFTSVGTNTVDASYSPTEWGLLSQSATGGGTMLDRVTFSAVALLSGDSLQTTFNLTFPAGG